MSAPEGLTLGRVVHFKVPEELVPHLGAEILAGSVSKINYADGGRVTIHLDVPQLVAPMALDFAGWQVVERLHEDPKSDPFSRIKIFGFQAVVYECAYDAEGVREGTWRYPPRVK